MEPAPAEKANEYTPYPWVTIHCLTSWPPCRSLRTTSPYRPTASERPSGEKATEYAEEVGCSRGIVRFPVCKSQRSTRPLPGHTKCGTASNRPSGENTIVPLTSEERDGRTRLVAASRFQTRKEWSSPPETSVF